MSARPSLLGAVADAVVATLALPGATYRLVTRVDALITEHVGLLETLTVRLDELGDALGVLLDPDGVVAQLSALLAVLPPAEAAAAVRGAAGVLPRLELLTGELPADTGPRLVGLLGTAESGLPVLGVLDDPESGLSAVVANTDHLVDLLDELMVQVRSIPGASALLRRGKRRIVIPDPVPD